MTDFEELKAIYDRLGTDERLLSLRAEQFFTRADYDRMLALAPHTETEEYSAAPCGDLYVRVVHRPFRPDPSRMIFIFNLDQARENLYNDDLYWRSEPVKFCSGIPSFEECIAAVDKLLAFRADKWESKSKVLNIPWDPKHPDFDS